jgi:hypothetical protein
MRGAIGLFAIGLLAFGLLAPASSNDALSGAAGACLRVGMVMAIWWFAYPQTQHLPRWLVVASVVTLFLVMRWPKLLVVAIPLLAVLWFLGPRTRGRAP